VPDACRTNCLYAWCGDKVVDSGEQCDDGQLNGMPGDSCDKFCRLTVQVATPGEPGTVGLPLIPGSQSPVVIRVPLTAEATGMATGHPPQGKTGPEAVAVMAAGAAAGYAWMKRRRVSRKK
jgi:cysteine-rich repeat protein